MSRESEEKRWAHNKGEKDFKKCDGLADSNPLTELFHPSYDPPKGRKSEYDSGWRTAEKHHKYGSDSGSGSFCFISTACAEARGLPDDCLELQVLRGFRDTYVREQPQGNDLIQRYYVVAPGIVRRINSRPDRVRVYTELYDGLVQRCVDLILDNKPEAALREYMRVVRSLEKQYAR